MKIAPLLLSSLGPVATAAHATAQDARPTPAFVNPTPGLTLTQANQLPASIANALLQQHGYNTGRPTYVFRIAQATPTTWSDSCLGLGGANELCGQVQVSGWQVTLTDDIQQWVYRTDASGLVIRLERTTSILRGFGGAAPPAGAPTNFTTPTAGQPPGRVETVTQPVAHQDWNAVLRWSRMVDSPDPELLFQLVVLDKPETRYANVVYQFYVREKGKTGWTYIYTTLGARLLDNGSGSVELPLESLRLDEVATKMGYNFNWANADIRVSVLLRYDLDRAQRDLRLKFQHESAYTAISPLSLTQIAQARTAPSGWRDPYTRPIPPGYTAEYVAPGTAQRQAGFISLPDPPPGVPILPPLATPYPYMN